MNAFVVDPRFAGIRPFEKRYGDVCIIGLTKKKSTLPDFFGHHPFEKSQKSLKSTSKEVGRVG